MPIPDADHRGYLPHGVHDASLAEILDRYGRFRETDRRVTLGAQLAEFAEEARASGLVRFLIIDGSYTTAKPQPGDIDLIVVLRKGVGAAAELRPDQYNVMSARRVKARHGFDVLHAIEDSETLAKTVEFFAQVVGEPDVSKGMVRVAL